MNEKFKQLAEQAEILIGEDSYGKFAVIPGHEKDPLLRLGKAESHDALKKFAELIVKECAGVTLDYKNDDHYAGWVDHAAEILKHFGVKE